MDREPLDAASLEEARAVVNAATDSAQFASSVQRDVELGNMVLKMADRFKVLLGDKCVA